MNLLKTKVESMSDVEKNLSLLSVGDVIYYSDSSNYIQYEITKIEGELLTIVDTDDRSCSDMVDGADLQCGWKLKPYNCKNGNAMTFRNDDYPLYPAWLSASEYEEIHD